MIGNRSNYLIPSDQDTKRKEGRTYTNSTTIKTLQAESQKDSLFPKILVKKLSKIKLLPGQTCKNIQRQNNKPQQKHRLGTVSKTLTCGGGGGEGVGQQHPPPRTP